MGNVDCSSCTAKLKNQTQEIHNVDGELKMGQKPETGEATKLGGSLRKQGVGRKQHAASSSSSLVRGVPWRRMPVPRPQTHAGVP